MAMLVRTTQLDISTVFNLLKHIYIDYFLFLLTFVIWNQRFIRRWWWCKQQLHKLCHNTSPALSITSPWKFEKDQGGINVFVRDSSIPKPPAFTSGYSWQTNKKATTKLGLHKIYKIRSSCICCCLASFHWLVPHWSQNRNNLEWSARPSLIWERKHVGAGGTGMGMDFMVESAWCAWNSRESSR